MSLLAEWIAAKQAEQDAKTRRMELEDLLVAELKINTADTKTKTFTLPDGKLKVVGRMNVTTDGDKLQELAQEYGSTDHLGRLFRWKPEINKQVWSAADAAITAPLLGAITEKPGRPSFSVEV